MFIRKWGTLGALLGAAIFAGCDENAMDEVQDEQQDVIEAQQDLREEETELNEAQQEARDEGTGPALGDPTITTPAVPPVQEPLPDDNADTTDEPTLAPLEGGSEADAAATEEVPDEGDPDAGTESTTTDESGSVDEETAAEEPEPATPE